MRGRLLTARLLAGVSRMAGTLLHVAPVELALDAATLLDEREARTWRTRGMRAVRNALDLCRRVTADRSRGAA